MEKKRKEEELDGVEELIRQYRPMVYAIGRRLHPSDPLDDDLLQNGLIGLWRAAERWDGVRPFPPLARRCITGEMASYLRRRYRNPSGLPLERVMEEPVFDDLTGAELEEAVDRAYPREPRKRALLLFLAQGYTMSDAAKSLDLRPSAARRMARNALLGLPGYSPR